VSADWAQAPPTLSDVLAARESRAFRQRLALQQANTSCVVSVTLVVPGPDKRPPWTAPVFDEADRVVREAIAAGGWGHTWEEVRRAAPIGPEALWGLTTDPCQVKAALVAAEDGHPIGRLWDLDVVVPSGPLSRAELGLPVRSCLACAEPAAGCARSRRHDVAALLAVARALVGRWELSRATPYAAAAHAALLAELHHTPKPGLVDLRNTGAHDDMDVPLFEASAEAIVGALGQCETLGELAGASASPAALPRLLAQLRPVGLAAEARMLDATGGVNTHRGAIFAFGLLCAAAGYLRGAGRPVTVAAVGETVARIAAPTLAELTVLAELSGGRGREASHGLAAHTAYGMRGARGEAVSGYATVRDRALPAYRRVVNASGDQSAALAQALLELLAAHDDTNLAARGGRTGVALVRRRATELLAAGGALAPGFREAMERFDDELIAARLSPGGTADLLGVTIFLAGLAGFDGLDAPV
jgi:holo-ACP synthase/triphosphoribosyl-dephospho-CoA synthase